MLGLMMNTPLTVTSILRHAAAYHGETEVVSRSVEGPIHRTNYATLWKRSQKLANALKRLGLKKGDRVATLAWNTWRHIELYYGISGSGFVCHTINPRLFKEQIAFIIKHAGDKVLFADLTFLPILESLAPQVKKLKAVVMMTDAAHMPKSAKLPKLKCYETLLEREKDAFNWPELNENTACSLCYTSGTTGEPKGALYSHRSSVLHAMTVAMPDVFGVSASAVVCPIVPMFHVNAWGIPYVAPMVGAKLVLPGPKLDGASLHQLMSDEGVSFTAGVPTVWLALLDWLDAEGKSLPGLKRVAIGGSAAPPVMLQRFAARGADVLHAWGMTETSPVGLAATLKAKHADLPENQKLALKSKQGRPLYGMEFLVVNGEGKAVQSDGVEFGALHVRGPWVASAYFKSKEKGAFARKGWFHTGDVVTMDGDGFVQIVDRTKDVIKSGGEWISSIEVENIAQAHPAIKEAAVVARPDEKWSERPVLVAVLKPGASFTKEDMVAHYAGKIAKWSIPEDLFVVEQLPHTATGKLLKTEIRKLVLVR
jgi:3-(methylthio)propionyl---CoA ligase